VRDVLHAGASTNLGAITPRSSSVSPPSSSCSPSRSVAPLGSRDEVPSRTPQPFVKLAMVRSGSQYAFIEATVPSSLTT
jgi:hypothetical protein